jgi:hypothetical protein
MPTERSDQGQAAAMVLALAAGMLVALTSATLAVGGQMIDRTRAQTAADAAALGSLRGGRAAARALADEHGATLVSYTSGPNPGQVTVVVRLGETTAAAAASDAP